MSKYLAGRALGLVAAGAIVLTTLAPAVASAESCYPSCTPTTPPKTKPQTVTKVEGEQVSNSSLPVTGGDVAGLVAIGAGAAVAGGLMVRGSRRRRAEA